jgi:S1-C subfamily serine protease
MGKLQEGDVFLSIAVNDGTAVEITRYFHLTDTMLEAQKAGDTITIKVLRDGTEMTFTFTLTEANFTDVDSKFGNTAS